ncbi:MAG: class I tRNA ligase family protein [bacterium]
MFKQLPNQTFPNMEDEVTDFWKKNRIFEKSVEQRDIDNPYSFVDGPPFVSGLPHYGHLLCSIAKDVVPRYWAMKGKRVRRVFGWDCHGLPIENKVNQKLNITNSAQVENEIGIEKYVEECRSYVENCIEDWQWYIDKVGRWVDMEHAYKTMYPEYSESVIWAFKQIYDKKLIYKGKRVSLFSTDTSTPVSSFEVAMDPDNYQDMEDPSVYVKFELNKERSDKDNIVLPYLETLKYPVYFSAWTTTPWTLPSNFALAVNPKEDYVLVKRNRSMKMEKCAGCILFKEGKYLLINAGADGYSPAKGHIEKDESSYNTAIRETQEETGYKNIKIVTNLGKLTYQFYRGKKTEVELSQKETQLFLAELNNDEKVAGEYETLWLTLDEVKEKLTYKDWVPFFEAADKIMNGKEVFPMNNVGQMFKEELTSFEYLVVAEKLLETLNLKDLVVAKKFKGADLVGLSYKPLFDFFKGNDNDFKVYPGDFVGIEDGTGIVHIAPAFGEDDFNLGNKYKLSCESDIDTEGKMTVGKYLGIYIRDASYKILNDLESSDVLLKYVKYTHRLPFYRGKNPLIYVAQEAYFVDLKKAKKRMLTLNKKVNWVPEYIKEGRFAQTVESAPDWCISRNRFWATVMPIWKTKDGEELVIGSIKELMGYTDKVIEKDENGKKKYYFKKTETEIIPFSFHRDICDKIVIYKDGKEYTRIPEVLDVWMDSGSVPFAEYHYPFENEEAFNKAFPADFIVEYIGQVRAWFNVLFRLSTLLFDKSPYKNVVCTGVLAGNDGRKMSKTYGNYPDPKEVLEKIGGDALRLYMMSSTIMSGGDMSWSDELLKKQVQNVLLPFWNTVKFFLIYAELHNYEPDQSMLLENGNLNLDIDSKNKLDRWIDMRLNQMISDFSKNIESYDIASGVKLIQPFVEDLSTWFVRRSRNRFSVNDKEALNTLYKILVRFSLAIAPVVPFISEKVYQVLVKSQFEKAKESIHLLDFPKALRATVSQTRLIESMAEVRSICNQIGALRNEAQIKIKQVLSESLFINENRRFDKWELELIQDEMNIKTVKQVDKFDALIVEGNWMKNEMNNIQLVLNVEITEELKKEGMLREVTRAIQSERKKLNMDLKTYAVLDFKGSANLESFLKEMDKEIKEACKIKEIRFVEVEKEEIKIGEDNAKIKLSVVN